MKQRLTASILAFLAIFSVRAMNPQNDIENFDPHRWNSETMVLASLRSDGVPAVGYTLCAYIDDELRGYTPEPMNSEAGPLYVIRVKGDVDDIGRIINIVVVDNTTGAIVDDSKLSVSEQLVWSGETIGLPSAPVIISLVPEVRPAEIVTVDGFSFYRQDYDSENPLSLTPLYTVLPDNAAVKTVDMELTAASRHKGRLEKRGDEWVFIPSATCAGEIDIRILASIDHMVGGLLTIEARVHAEEIILHRNAVELEIGETIDITPFFEVGPEDASDKSVIVTGQEHVEIETRADGSYVLHAVSVGTDEVVIALHENPAVAVTVTATVIPIVDAIEVSMHRHSDDMVNGSGDVLACRQTILSPRVFTVVSNPVGSRINADNISWTVNRNGAQCPQEWAEYAVVAADDAENVVEFEITPLVPGAYNISCVYKDKPVTDSVGNPIVWNFDAVMGVDLSEGWNWFGSAPANNGPKLSESLPDKNTLVEARTQRSFLINDPELGYVMGFADPQGNWTNDFTLDAARDNGHFRIKLANTADAPARLLYNGDYDFMNAEWKVSEGWNWVNAPAIYLCPISAINNFGIFKENDIIKSRNYVSVFTYYGWEGTLQYLEPGEAYALYTSYSGKIDIDISEIDQPYSIGRTSAKPKPSDYNPYRFMDNMAIIAEIDDLDCSDCSLKVFSGSECRGEGRYVNGRWYIVAHGESDDIFTFAIEDNHTGALSYIDYTIGFSDMAGTYTAPVKMSLGEKSRPMIYASGASIIGAERIYDIQGRDVTAANGSLAPGIYIAKVRNITVKITIN